MSSTLQSGKQRESDKSYGLYVIPLALILVTNLRPVLPAIIRSQTLLPPSETWEKALNQKNHKARDMIHFHRFPIICRFATG